MHVMVRHSDLRAPFLEAHHILDDRRRDPLFQPLLRKAGSAHAQSLSLRPGNFEIADRSNPARESCQAAFETI